VGGITMPTGRDADFIQVEYMLLLLPHQTVDQQVKPRMSKRGPH
jgi:hypothetical protein